MKKRILCFMFITAIAVGAGWNISRSMNETTLSDMALENVEAPADGEVVGFVCQTVYIAICKPGIAGLYVGDIIAY
ncbi:MAG: NVEALA domain-containing protein [Prevotellaceae bacterium]|jgi:hypothetical protein|nr:NVEALA domain-containing protein [Prevotellaceae bacterium]